MRVSREKASRVAYGRFKRGRDAPSTLCCDVLQGGDDSSHPEVRDSEDAPTDGEFHAGLRAVAVVSSGEVEHHPETEQREPDELHRVIDDFPGTVEDVEEPC